MNRTRAAAKAVTKEFKANASIMKEFQKEAKDPAFKWQSWRYGPNPLPTIKNYTGATSLEDDERERREYEEGLEQHLRDLNEYHRTHDSNGYRIPEPITNASQSVDAAQQNQAIQQAEEATKRIQESANNASTALQNVSTAAENVNSSAADATSGLVGVDKELKRKKTDGDKAAGALQNVADEEKKTGEEGEKGSKGVSKFGKVLGSIGRIAQTLLIRTAIKSLYKAFSESWQAMYQFSKANDGAFAQSLERMKGLLHGA
ncbi:MAG: hypothetical protein IIZ78_28515, partial [Clostridiales bacterium]|nr:hypothetical protein [Clostridiales bacterium]